MVKHKKTIVKIVEDIDNDPEDTILDRVLGVVDDQLISLQTLCEMLEIDEKELLEQFKERVIDCKAKFGILDDVLYASHEVLSDEDD